MTRRNDPLRSTLVAPADYAHLIAYTSPRAALKATLPVDPACNAALLAMRDSILADIYSSILVPA